MVLDFILPLDYHAYVVVSSTKINRPQPATWTVYTITGFDTVVRLYIGYECLSIIVLT